MKTIAELERRIRYLEKENQYLKTCWLLWGFLFCKRNRCKWNKKYG
ncbi:MAG: hypothetical protein NC180_06440 [Muribaculaceae bacterium]|nr:hypothetical protein [Muribaculaceae bacterium]